MEIKYKQRMTRDYIPVAWRLQMFLARIQRGIIVIQANNQQTRGGTVETDGDWAFLSATRLNRKTMGINVLSKAKGSSIDGFLNIVRIWVLSNPDVSPLRWLPLHPKDKLTPLLQVYSFSAPRHFFRGALMGATHQWFPCLQPRSSRLRVHIGLLAVIRDGMAYKVGGVIASMAMKAG